MQQERKITVFKEVEWIAMLYFEQLYSFGSRIIAVFIIFQGGTPPKIFNNFLLIYSLQSAKSCKCYISFCLLV